MLSHVRTSVIAFAATILVASAAIGGWAWWQGRAGGTDGALIGGPFSLVNQDGARVTEASYDGRIKLILFGFTHCPDVCPTGLATMAEALRQLGPDAGKVQALFVSVDPERDTPAVLKDYLGSFPGIVGLTGTPDEVAAASRAYRVYAEKVSPEGGPPAPGATDYVVDHTALMFLMGPKGEYLGFFRPGVAPDEVAAGIRQHLG